MIMIRQKFLKNGIDVPSIIKVHETAMIISNTITIKSNLKNNFILLAFNNELRII